MSDEMNRTAPETKGSGGDAGRVFEDFMEAFEAFKETNDARLAELEQRGQADQLVEEKLARIEQTLDATKKQSEQLALKAARPVHGGDDVTSPEHKTAFERYVRSGDLRGLIRLVVKRPTGRLISKMVSAKER